MLPIFAPVPALPIIPAVYFGPVELYRFLASQESIRVDIGEHYERQSYRTRMAIMGPNGVQDLVVQIRRRSGEKMPMHTVGLSSDEPWRQQHLHAIRSAYGKSPWFIHYIDVIEELLLNGDDHLTGLDIASMHLCLGWLGIQCHLNVQHSYIEDPHAVDLRQALHPKKNLPPLLQGMQEYPQVFADRHGFRPQLSVLDLLFNCGPQARTFLLR